MLKRASYAWTAVDEAKLKLLVAKGLYLRSIAFRLRRSEYSISQRARELGITLKAMPRLRADGTIYVRPRAPASPQRFQPKPLSYDCERPAESCDLYFLATPGCE